jgi:hypothetical protein
VESDGDSRAVAVSSAWFDLQRKELARNHSKPAQLIWALLQISSDNSDDDGGGGKLDSHCTHCSTGNTKDHNHSIGMVGSTRTGNSHIRMDRSDNRSSDNQPQFLPKLARQNAALERKPIRTSSMQLTEAFSL